MSSDSNERVTSRSDYRVNDDFIREAIEHAHPNALRLALYQSTGDPQIGAIRAHKKNVGGRELMDFRLEDDDWALIKDKAFDYLREREPGTPPSPPPGKEEGRELLELFTEPMSDIEFEFAWEELAFDEFPRDVHWSRENPPENLSDFNAIVIGAGISGIAAAIQLKRLGIPFVVLERQAGLGGTWYLNRYPEIRVDTSSYLYQFKFEKNFRWTEHYPDGRETREYLEYIAGKYDVSDDFLFNREVISAQWDDSSSRWRVTVRRKDGREEVLDSNVVVSAAGLFSKPKFPDIPGIGDFEGAIFHTANWDHDVDCTKKRVALVGTGSTGSQLTPATAKIAKQFTIFQRTPNWIMAQPNYRDAVRPTTRWLFDTMPFYWNWFSYASYFAATQMQYVQEYDPEWQAKGGTISEYNDKMREILTEYIKDKVGHDPELFEKVLPEHAPLTRRLVVDNNKDGIGFYDTLLRDNVDLVTDDIERFTKTGIVTKDGVEREFDVIVLASGYEVHQFFWPVRYVGRNGMSLEKLWEKDGERSYLGLTMPGFPNFLIFYGPNGQPRSGGFYSWAEIWARYVGKMLVKMVEKNVDTFEVKKDVFDKYNDELDEQMKNIIWEAPGHCYYVNQYGRAALNVPWTTHEYHEMVREPRLEDFELETGNS